MNTLSGRFLILTVLFITLAEVFIFMPTVARYREEYLLARLERAQIASLALQANEKAIDKSLEEDLLRSADVLSIVLLQNDTRQIMLSEEQTDLVTASYDLRNPPAWTLMRDAMSQLFNPKNSIIRVMGEPLTEIGVLIEITIPSAPLRAAMISYSLQIFIVSAIIAFTTAALLFFSVRRLLVLPIHRLVRSMTSYQQSPQNASLIIEPENTVTELREAEGALHSLQTQLTFELKQRERLAQLGEAVAKISHDLRNILSVTTLLADRLENSSDPAVQRITPKIIASLTRAVNLTEATLAFGSAKEPEPRLTQVSLHPLVQDIIENDRLTLETETNSSITYTCSLSPDVLVRADTEQLHRVLSNLIKNAREAIIASKKSGSIIIDAQELNEGWQIHISDTGPGLPQKAQEHLFQPFQGGVRKGGNGLGLAIAAEIIKGHGGTIELSQSTAEGTTFIIWLPTGLTKKS